MTNYAWLAQAKQHATPLKSLLASYHPIGLRRHQAPRVTITAGSAERACEVFRKQIRENSEGDPVVDFDEALRDGDIRRAYRLLDQAWFGVPESRSAWGITGFEEAVALLEDQPGVEPPEEEEP